MAHKMLASASIAAAVSAASAVDRSAAGVPNMNGEYVISKTPGAGDAEFNTKWSECASPGPAVPLCRRLLNRHAPGRLSGCFACRGHVNLSLV